MANFPQLTEGRGEENQWGNNGILCSLRTVEGSGAYRYLRTAHAPSCLPLQQTMISSVHFVSLFFRKNADDAAHNQNIKHCSAIKTIII